MVSTSEALTAAIKLHEAGELEQATRHYRQVLADDPRCAPAWHALGLAAHEQGRLAEAAECYERALAIDPAMADALCNLGTVLKQQGRLPEATVCYQRALAVKPRLVQGQHNLATILKQQGRLDEAEHAFRLAMELDPSFAEAHFGLGVTLQSQDRLADAERCFREAIRLNPKYVAAYDNLSVVCRLQDRLSEALDFCGRALALDREHVGARINRALARLTQGDLQGGWADYEARWELPGAAHRPFQQPQWHGEPLAGRVLLVHAEQGLGDTLQFARYVKQLQERGEQVAFEVPARLVPLLLQSGFKNVFAESSSLPPFDVQIPLLSLPRVLGTTLATIPAAVPYLSANPLAIDHWRDTLAGVAGLRVGIAWQGSTDYPFDRYRSIPLKHFQALALPNATLISLQQGLGSEQIAEVAESFFVRELGGPIDAAGAFLDTAAILLNLDLVVTSDTAMAHLAGALGVPVWVALPLAADWRWLSKRGDNPWYPTMRLFRQQRLQDWESVFAEIARELELLASKGVHRPHSDS